MPALREGIWEAENNYRSVISKLPLRHLAFTAPGKLSSGRLCAASHPRSILRLSTANQGICYVSWTLLSAGISCTAAALGNPALAQELAQASRAALESPATLLLALRAREVTVRQGVPFPEALLWGIHTCVLNSCLWSRGGGLGCGCGSGSGGACAGPGSGSATSAAPGKPIGNVSASAPETVICREHRQPQCLGSAPLSSS